MLPRQLYVITYKRAKYLPRDETVAGAGAGVKIAPRPAQIIPKSLGHSSLLASLVSAKFVDALPLYRQEKIFAREGITLSRQTMAGLLMQLQSPLAPIAAALKAALRQGAVVQNGMDQSGRSPDAYRADAIRGGRGAAHRCG